MEADRSILSRYEQKKKAAEDDQTLNIRPSPLYLVARRYPVDDVFQVADHLLLPEVGGKRLRPLRQQLQDFGTKLANPSLMSRRHARS